MIIHRLATGLVLCSLAGTASAQQAGRSQDGFYSGQSNSQTNGNADSRVDGRANRKEGVPPAAADVNKQNQTVPDRSAPTSAESMDSVVRPGVQR